MLSQASPARFAPHHAPSSFYARPLPAIYAMHFIASYVAWEQATASSLAYLASVADDHSASSGGSQRPLQHDNQHNVTGRQRVRACQERTVRQ